MNSYKYGYIKLKSIVIREKITMISAWQLYAVNDLVVKFYKTNKYIFTPIFMSGR